MKKVIELERGNKIFSPTWSDVSGIEGVRISTSPEKINNVQSILVEVSSNSIIHPHRHDTIAIMMIVDGGAEVLTESGKSGKFVKSGDIVFFNKNEIHGFIAGVEGLRFVSVNGGIVHHDGSLDLTFA